MKNAILIALVTFVASSAVYAEPPSPPAKAAPAAAVPAVTPTATKAAAPQPTAAVSQQDRMRNCNKEATGKKGDERRAFMKTCLSSKT
jgi:hypothetical protein